MKYLLSEVTKQRRCQEATELEELVLEQITLFLGGHATIVVAIIGIVANSLAVAVFCRSSLLLTDSDIKTCHVNIFDRRYIWGSFCRAGKMAV